MRCVPWLAALSISAAHPQAYWANVTDAIWSPGSPHGLKHAVAQHPKGDLSHKLGGVRVQLLGGGANGAVAHIRTPECDVVAKQIFSTRGIEDSFCHEVEMMMHAASVDAGPRVYAIDMQRSLVIMQHHPVPLISELQCMLQELQSPQLQPSERHALEAHAQTRCNEYRGALQRLTDHGMLLGDLKPEHIIVDLPPRPGVKLIDFGFARCCSAGEAADRLNHRWHLLQPDESCLDWANRSDIDARAHSASLAMGSARWCERFRSMGLSVLSWNSSMEEFRGDCGPEPPGPIERRLPAGCSRSKAAPR